MWQIIEYFNQNPSADAAQAISYFEKEFEVAKQIQILKNEGSDITKLKASIRPLYGEKRELEEKMKYVESDMEMEIVLAYPPRQGTDAQRTAKRNELRKTNVEYQDYDRRIREINDKIYELEDQVTEVDRNAKNARRLTELLTSYIQFIMQYKKNLF